MERLVGHSLAECLESWRAVPLRETLAILDQIADALEHLHAAGIVHRAIEPANVLVLEGAPLAVKVTELGHALLDEATYLRLTRRGTLLAAPQYLAPELARGFPPTPASDVYALGCVAFEMLAGRPAFAGAPSDVLAAKMLRDPPRLDDIGTSTREIASVIARAMSPRATDRPTAAAFVRALRRAVPGERPRLDGGAIALPMNDTLVVGALALTALIGTIVLVLALALR
jgi:serine/threonine-protein kinase